MTAYACGSGGVIFVPEKIEKKTEGLMAIRRSNDNSAEEAED